MGLRDEMLPVSPEDVRARGWDRVDFVLVSGDAYVDHPSFGVALIGRWLLEHGYRVAILAQPDWKSVLPYKTFGKPALGFMVTGGNLDSILSNYTAAGKPRRKDAYSPGGIGGRRPDHATVVYANRCREAYRGVPIILGGIEASLRRFVHYDSRDNKIRRSILFDARADLLIYGMAEGQVLEVASILRDGGTADDLHQIAGCAWTGSEEDLPEKHVLIPSYEEIIQDRKKFAQAFALSDREQNPHFGKPLIQGHGDRFLIQNPPAMPLSQEMMDRVYGMDFTRSAHPDYQPMGGVPALEEVLYSLVSHRGCYGGCSFCALTFHQGKAIQRRSKDSLLREAGRFILEPGFKGNIHDVGGPTANFRTSACEKMDRKGACRDKNCVGVEACDKLKPDHSEYLDILRSLRSMDGIKRVFVRSGIRYDYVLLDKDRTFLNELCEHHVSGQLKVAPEHISAKVLSYMGKPGPQVFEEFQKRYFAASKKAGKEQYLVPYLMSSHPGSDLDAAIELAIYMRDHGIYPEQVQDFVPSPGSLSTAMFWSHVDPRDMKPVYIPESREEKEMQRALLQFRDPANHNLVRRALQKAGRSDLIGFGGGALVPPARGERENRGGDRSRPNSHPKESGHRQGTGKRKPTPEKGSRSGESRSPSEGRRGSSSRKDQKSSRTASPSHGDKKRKPVGKEGRKRKRL